MKLLQLVFLLLDYTFHLLLLDYTFYPKSTIFNLSLITSTCLVLNNLPHLLVWMYDASLLCKFFWYQSFGMYHSFRILGFTACEMQLPRVPGTPMKPTSNINKSQSFRILEKPITELVQKIMQTFQMDNRKANTRTNLQKERHKKKPGNSIIFPIWASNTNHKKVLKNPNN